MRDRFNVTSNTGNELTPIGTHNRNNRDSGVRHRGTRLEVKWRACDVESPAGSRVERETTWMRAPFLYRWYWERTNQWEKRKWVWTLVHRWGESSASSNSTLVCGGVGRNDEVAQSDQQLQVAIADDASGRHSLNMNGIRIISTRIPTNTSFVSVPSGETEQLLRVLQQEWLSEFFSIF